ncbi:hypothetical protein D3C73_1368680 [compost metagenome]
MSRSTTYWTCTDGSSWLSLRWPWRGVSTQVGGTAPVVERVWSADLSSQVWRRPAVSFQWSLKA